MFSLFKRSSARKKRFTHFHVFRVEVPDSWRQNGNPKYLSLTDAAGLAAITGHAFAKRDGGSLADFAETRFAAVAEMEFYSQEGDERRFQANDRDFVIREFSGTWPDETEPHLLPRRVCRNRERLRLINCDDKPRRFFDE